MGRCVRTSHRRCIFDWFSRQLQLRPLYKQCFKVAKYLSYWPVCPLLLFFLHLTGSVSCSPPGSSVHGILQARILEWVAMSFSRGYSWPRDWTWVPCIAGRFFTVWATRELLPCLLCVLHIFPLVLTAVQSGYSVILQCLLFHWTESSMGTGVDLSAFFSSLFL